MWKKPLKGQSEDGKIVNIIVIDSEGLGAVDQDSNHDCRIFALVLLISSMFLYNSTGTIDENAISNLSLVVSITKHIHIKSKNEDMDTEEYAAYFPSFLWVLRDFTLQLVDQGGEDISSTQYLENSLCAQKGFSDEIEEKNRIRRQIQTLFKDRDCFTMIRPLTDEEDLQSLDQTDIEKLRPEFIEQVLDLRKRIFSGAKCKMLRGKPLNGAMLCGLIRNYVHAINQGAVPNIESAWSYICKNQCQKVFEECFKMYMEGMEEKTDGSGNYPLAEDSLKEIYKELKEMVEEKFRKEAMGDNVEAYLAQLRDKIKDKYVDKKADNRVTFENLLLTSMNNFYGKIDQKLKSGDVKNYFEFEKEMRGLRSFFMDLDAQGPNKEFLINDYI